MESEKSSETVESTNASPRLISKSNKTKLKKLKSIKLNRPPSFRSSMARRPKSNLRDIVVDMPSDDESPPYSTSSSQFSALSQKSAPTLKRGPSFNKSVRALTRLYSKKQKKPAIKIYRSTTRPENSKLGCDRSSVVLASTSSNSAKASTLRSGLSIGRTKSESSIQSRPSLVRKASLRPLRVTGGNKTKRSPTILDPGVERATCSSALKGSKMACQIESELEADHSAMKVCPFSYCSLHGHRHKSAPPLKHLISIRRRLLKNDRTTSVEIRTEKPRGTKVNIGVQTDFVDEADTWIETESLESVNGSESPNEIAESMSTTGSNSRFLGGLANKQEQSEDVDTLIEACSTESGNSFELQDEVAETISKSRSNSGSFDGLVNEQEQSHREEKENFNKGDRHLQFPLKESEPKNPNNESLRMKLKDQKYVKMWRLMYKHAVKEAPDGSENRPGQQVPSNDDQDSTSESDSVNEAVDVVQRAFDEILLPEIQDQSRAVGGEDDPKEAKTASGFGDKNTKWSALKKIFILKRFVKALDKLKHIQRGAHRVLPLQPEPGDERVNLRRQTSEEKKSAEDWMLDYALRQVVSKLDPDQQRQVGMLVKAFETILPLPDPNTRSPKLTVAKRSNSDKIVGEEECINSDLSRRTFSRGQDTDSLEADSFEQELGIKNILCRVENQGSTDPSVVNEKSFSSILARRMCSRGQGTDFQEAESSKTELDIGDTKSESGLDGKSVSCSSSPTTESAEAPTQSEKQSYMRLWGFVYTHMMENIPGDSEGKKPENVTIQIFPLSGAENDQKAILRRIEAIKLIEKAIDDVILPESQDSLSPPDSQSAGSDEEKPKNVVVAAVEEEKVAEKEEGKTEKRRSEQNWSKLKQKILLRRFIKAFDDARKFNPRGPRFLEPQADPEAERVRLRAAEMDERKNAEEWMVDRALQQAVARLTPDRKKKVHLLVQAFEAVKA